VDLSVDQGKDGGRSAPRIDRDLCRFILVVDGKGINLLPQFQRELEELRELCRLSGCRVADIESKAAVMKPKTPLVVTWSDRPKHDVETCVL
jgi:hypothetical protein